jgi:hypothetical protein
MAYDFRVYRNDIVLDVNDTTRNYGRDFVVKMPIVLWYAYKQFTKSNLFGVIEMPDFIANMEEVPRSSLDNLIDSVLHASENLPKKLNGNNGINTDLKNWGLSSFKGPENIYGIRIINDSLQILKDSVQDIEIPSYAVNLFLSNYLNMISDYDDMIAFRLTTAHICRRLMEEL